MIDLYSTRAVTVIARTGAIVARKESGTMGRGLLLAWFLGALLLPSTKVSAQDDAPNWPSSLGWQASGGGDDEALIGAIDQPSPGATISGDSFTVAGWVGDPQAPDGTNVVNVRLYDGDLLLADSQRGDYGGSHAAYGLDRPDVVEALGLDGLESSGFQIDVPTRSFQNGPHTLTVRALRGDGVWAEDQVQIMAAAKASGQTPPRPAAAPANISPATANIAPLIPVVILVQGFASSSDEDYMPVLRADLMQQGIPDNKIFRFSYSGGSWNGTSWTAAPYSRPDTEQPLDASAGQLRQLVAHLRQLRSDQAIYVVGFSLGGLVAIQELVQATSAADQSSTPNRVLAISAPLNGIDIATKCRAASRVANSGLAAGVLGAVVGAPTLADLGVGGVGLYVASFCPNPPLAGNLNGIYSDANWRSWRDGQVRQAMQAGTLVGTMRNTVDCVYYLALCSQDFGGDDVDDRWTNTLSAATFQDAYREADHSWWWKIRASHSDILSDYNAMARAAAFASGH